MTKKSKILLIAGIAALIICVVVAASLFFFWDKTPQEPTNDTETVTCTYTVEVQSASGLALSNVGMYIYEDDTLKELIAYIKTDETGAASFTDAKLDTYVAVIDKVPTGYAAEPFYPLTGEYTQIILATGQMSDADVEKLVYKLGDAVLDFSVTGPDGTVYTLSELFKGKKAMVLNFFYNECQPCMSEFPYLQEAYKEYKDDIAVLAMNPVNNDDVALKALIKKLGVTFPMVNCGSEWESIMQITAYPTTVFIDRFGNICLIHTGAVPDAKTFKDAFAYFAAEKYEAKLIEKIEDLLIEEEEGTEENPIDVGGVTSFEVTVEPGQVVYTDLYKIKNMYLQIRSKYAYVIYNEKTYNPKNGVVGLIVSAPDTFTPATIGIGNSGTETQTFKVTLGVLAGTFNNPYKMELGEFDVDVQAGNDQGVYYVYTAQEDGILTLQCLSSSVSKYDYYLYNLSTSAMRNLMSDSQVDANGAVTVSVKAKKGEKVQVCISTLPDDSGTYPAGSFRFKAQFIAETVQEEEIVPTTDYTVTVKDDASNPVANVSMVITVGDEQKAFTTNQEGKIAVTLPTGSYKGMFYLPEGYLAQSTEFELTEAVPNVVLTISKIKQFTYTVKLQGSDGAVIPDVLVKIGENDWLRTNADGVASLVLNEGDYTVTIMIPSGFVGQSNYAFAAGSTELTITLDYIEGSEKNPYKVTQYPYTTPMISKGKEIFVSFSWQEIVALQIRDADAYVRVGERIYRADDKGMVTVPLEGLTSPAVMAIGNGGNTRERYKLVEVYPAGNEKNPYLVDSYPYTTAELAAQQEIYCTFHYRVALSLQIDDPAAYVRWDGVTYTADENGVVTVPLDDVAAPVTMAIGNSNTQTKTFTVQLIEPALGSEKNPYLVDSYPYTMPELAAQQEVFCAFHYKVALSLQIDDPAAYVIWDGVTYTADENGVVTVPLDEIAAPVTMVIGNSDTQPKTFTVQLNVPPLGSVKNPYDVTEFPYDTPAIESQQEMYFLLQMEGAKILQIHDADAYVRIGENVYSANSNGIVEISVEKMDSTILAVVGNKGTESKVFRIELIQFALGSENYPHRIQDGTLPQLVLEQGNAAGYYYTYTAAEEGIFTLTVNKDPCVAHEIKLSTEQNQALLSESEALNAVSIEVLAGDTVTIWVCTLVDPQIGTNPAATMDMTVLLAPKPEDPPEEEDIEYTYLVKVTDAFGAPMAGIGVIFLENGNPVQVVNTDADGMAEMYTFKLTQYTVELFFDGQDFYYDKAAAVLPANNRKLTLKLVKNLDETDGQEIYILNGNKAYNLYVGGVHLQVGSGKSNFSAENDNNCFFVFTPTEAGTYRITASDAQTELSFWGSDWFISKQYTSKDEGRGNAITEDISGTSVGNTTFVIGIKADESVRDVVLNIARIGDPAFNISDQPWNEWESGYTHSGTCNVSTSGTATYFDLKATSGTYNLYYDEANGYYRLYQNGPVIMVNLGANTNTNGTFVGLYERVNGNGQYGGAAITQYFFDSTGAFVKKENYTECFYECFQCAGMTAYNQTKYHPLTQDLMYALQNGFASWWDNSSENYLPVFATANREYAWMFACCYFQ